MMNPLIIKLGGVLLDSEEALERLFSALVNYRESHQRPLVIVHGGGCVVDELMKGLNLPVKKKNGLRVTPADQIDIITGALAGTANKTLLAWAKKHQIAAVGLFLGDGDSVKVTQLDEELGHVGLAQPGSPKLINSLLENGYLPVVSSIGVTDEGQLMNVNADQAATALAGTAYEIDREQLAGWLGFASATRNSLDSVSDRDHVLELLSAAAIGMVHLSRFAEDLIFFNTGEAGFVELSDRVTSGSSLMPQKKNPDALELIRGKCGRVQGALTGMMMTLKGLPLAYNKDMQEDKEGLFDALDTWLDCLHMAALVLDGIQVKRPRCQEAAQQGYANATELADYLVAKGVPFREAHHIVGEAVVEAIRQGKPLEDLPLDELQKFSPVIDEDVYPILSLQSCLDKRAAKGGVSPQQVAQAIAFAQARLG